MAKNQFELKKGGGKRTFDLDKGDHRHFDLKKDTEPAPDDNTVETPVIDEPERKPSRRWLICICALVIGGVVAWLLFAGESEKSVADDTEQPAYVETEGEPAAETAVEVPQAESAQTNDTAAQPAEAAAQPEAPAQTPAESEARQAAPAVTPATPPTADIEAEALKVIRGDYGNGQARRDALGNRYAAIQARVNQIMAQ